jgi:hypothetical protein
MNLQFPLSKYDVDKIRFVNQHVYVIHTVCFSLTWRKIFDRLELTYELQQPVMFAVDAVVVRVKLSFNLQIIISFRHNILSTS